MSLLLDAFGFLSVILRGIGITLQSLTIGGIAFLALLAHPLGASLDPGPSIIERSLSVLRWSAIGFAVVTALSISLETIILSDTIDLGIGKALGADFVLAGLAIIAA